jgi:hypothetical protein
MTLPLVASATVDVALAARRRLAAVEAVRAVLGPVGGGSEASTWLFHDEFGVVVEGSSSTAAVVSVAGAWARPNSHNTARFPRLRLELIADASRDAGLIVRRDAESRLWAAWEPFDTELHRPMGFDETWGRVDTDRGLRVWGSQLLSHPDVLDVADFDGGKKLICHYGLSVG